MNSANVVHHKPVAPAVSPVQVLDELVKKAVRKEWLELDYGAQWWTNDHAPTIYANSKLIPPLTTYISNRWAELKPILVKRPVAAKKIRLRKTTDEETSENDVEAPSEGDGHTSSGDSEVTLVATSQSSDHQDTLDLLRLLLDSSPGVKPLKVPTRPEDDGTSSNSVVNNQLVSTSMPNVSTNTVETNFRTEETSTISPSTYPSTSSDRLQSFNFECNTLNPASLVNQSYPQVKQVKDRESLKMKIKLSDKNKKEKESSSGNKSVKARDSNKPKKLKTSKSDAPKKRIRTIKFNYPSSYLIRKCFVKMERLSDEVLKRYTGLNSYDLKSYYSKHKSLKSSSNHKTKVKPSHSSGAQNNNKNLAKVCPRNICGSPPGPLSKKPWNLPNAKNNKKLTDVTAKSSQSSNSISNNIVLKDTSITPIVQAHSSTTPSNSCASNNINCSEIQNSLSSKPLSPVKLCSLSLEEKLELLGESLSITKTSLVECTSSGNEKVNGEITAPSIVTPSVNQPINVVSESEMTLPLKVDREPAKIVTAPIKEDDRPEKSVTAPISIEREPTKMVSEPEPTKIVNVSVKEVSELTKTVNAPMGETSEPASLPIVNGTSSDSAKTVPPNEVKQIKVISDPTNSNAGSGDIPLEVTVKKEPDTDSSDIAPQIINKTNSLNSYGLSIPNVSNEPENPTSNVDNKKLENRTKPRNNELLVKMLGSPPSAKSKPIADYVNGKIIALGQKHCSAVLIKRKSEDNVPVIAASLSIAANESIKESKKLKEDSPIKEIASPDHTTDVNMNYSSKILLNGFTTKSPTIVKSKYIEISPVGNDKPDSTESNKENTSYERNKLEDSPSPPAKKLKTDEHAEETITKSKLKIDLSKMELEPEEVLDKTSTTNLTRKINNKTRPVLDLPLVIFQDYECITCSHTSLHYNAWRLHFSEYPQCANAQDSV